MPSKYRKELTNPKDPANIGMIVGFIGGTIYAYSYGVPIYLALVGGGVMGALVGRTFGDAFVPERPPGWELTGY